MVLVGRNVCGNYDEPTPETWFYRQGPAKTMRRTSYPRHPLSTYQIVKGHAAFADLTKGWDEDALDEWQAMGVGQDGDLLLGRRYWGGAFYGLTKDDTALLRRYLRSWRRFDWFGARSWLYAQGLHAAVHQRKPLTCQEVPPRGSGGYSHWHCQRRRGHGGDHQFNNYKWTPGEPVRHEPAVA